MEYWKDPQEAVTAILKLHEAVSKDPELGESMKKVNQLIWYDYTEDGPGCAVWVDCRGGQFSFGAGDPPDKPDLIMSLSADDAHRSWSDKLNPVMAITRKKIRIKGSATGLLKLAPKLKKVAAIYVQVLKDMGWEEKIIK
jgi:putative sterol carrier protein